MRTLIVLGVALVWATAGAHAGGNKVTIDKGGHGPREFVGTLTEGMCHGPPGRDRSQQRCICVQVTLEQVHFDWMMKNRNGWAMSDKSESVWTQVYKTPSAMICRWSGHPDLGLIVRKDGTKYKAMFRVVGK